MRHLWQWFCGYVQICLNGRQINRFLNLCSRNGISLWKITYDLERRVRVHIGLKDFYYLKPYLRKTKTNLRIINKKGFPFWCHRHPRLKWLLVIFFCCICLLFYSYTFVWKIELHGNEKISSNELLRYLEEHEITVGMKRNAIDCTEIEYLLRQNYNQLGWVSVYMDHASLCIEMKESLYDEFHDFPIKVDRAYHLIANKDAKIDSIITRSGTAVVEATMSVKKGDILVLGQCEIYDDIGEIKEIMQVYAQALIYGDVTYNFLEPLTEIEVLSLKIAGKYNNQALEFIANQKINRFIEKIEENGVIILNKNVMIDKKEKNIVFIGEVKAREQIGINIPAEEVWEYEFE